MARIHYVKKAQKQWTCEKCGKAIEAGQPYKHVSPRSGPWEKGRKRVRCADCPGWKPSELTTSKMSGVYDAQEGFTEHFGGWEPGHGLDDLKGGLEDFAGEVESVADEYEESAQNIEDGFGHETTQSQELQEKAEELRSWADEVRCALEDVDEELVGDDLQSAVEDAMGITEECPV